MFTDITFGQYFPTDSIVHKLDPRSKIVLMLLLIVFVLLATNYYSLLLCTIFCITVLLATQIPVKMYLKNLKAILPIIIFTSLLNAFYTNSGTLLLQFWVLKVTTDGISRAVFMASRVVLLIILSSVLTYTTTPNDITDALENLFSPLKYIKLGNVVHMLTMMMTIALRFIPSLIEETNKIINAQKSRGADIDSGGFLSRIKALVPVLIPLIILSVKRAYELAEAMESRCYNGGVGKKRMKQMKLKFCDAFAIVYSVIVCGGILVLNNLL